MSAHLKHTPGPWVIREGANSHVFDGRLSPTSDEDATIAFVDLDTPDARLIAAAPDLAEALREIEDVLANMGRDADHDGLADLARAALAKAHGQ